MCPDPGNMVVGNAIFAMSPGIALIFNMFPVQRQMLLLLLLLAMARNKKKNRRSSRPSFFFFSRQNYKIQCRQNHTQSPTVTDLHPANIYT